MALDRERFCDGCSLFRLGALLLLVRGTLDIAFYDAVVLLLLVLRWLRRLLCFFLFFFLEGLLQRRARRDVDHFNLAVKIVAQVGVSFAFPLRVNFHRFPAKAKYQIECLLTVPLSQTSILDL